MEIHCKFFKDGCKEILKLINQQNHEINCVFQKCKTCKLFLNKVSIIGFI